MRNHSIPILTNVKIFQFPHSTCRIIGQHALCGKENLIVSEYNSNLPQIAQYNVLILDVTLPDGTGFEVCERVRKHGSRIPIIFLTASDEEVNIIRGLDCGGDDYITKPFKLGELCSRIRALLRRAGLSEQEKTASFSCGDIQIDPLKRHVLLRGKILELTATEYRLVYLLIKNANRVVTREIILDEIWDSTGDYVDNNTLSVYVRRLREKIEKDPSCPEHLLTVRGFGSCVFSDARMGNSSIRGAYYCFGLFIYGFLVLIGLITIFNIVNSIAMSVAARMKQYGAFRAIGLSSRQLVKMIVAEASAYAVTGCILGSVLGIMSNKFLFGYLVSSRWGSPWEIPVAELGIIIAVVAIAVLLAVSAPVRKIREMSIVDTISAL